jgi:hypothetical protein
VNKFIPFMLLFFFISGTFATTVTPVSASKLVEDSWNVKMSMSQARFGLGIVAVDNKIYAIGGATSFNTYDGSVGGFVGTNECYDSVTDTWITLKPMPTPRYDFAIVAYQGKIYCIGGNAAGEMRWPPMGCGITEVYDPATNSWSTKKLMPTNGRNLQAHVIDGKIFVLSATDSALNMYDPIKDSWTKKADMPLPNGLFWIFGNCLVSAVVDNKITVWMLQLKPDIYTYNFNSETTEQRTIIYNPATDVWDERTIEPVTFVGSGVARVTTGLYAPQNIYILKWVSSGEHTINQVYDSVKGTWTTAKIMPTPRRDFGVAVVDDILYVIGGRVAKLAPDYDDHTLVYDISSVNEQYVPIGYGSALSSNPSPSASEDTSSSGSSESKPLWTFLTETIVAIIVLTIGVAITISLFFYLRKIRKGVK